MKKVVLRINKRCDPEMAGLYYYIGSSGEIYHEILFNKKHDDGFYNLGNTFRTREQAQFELDKRLFLVKAQDWAKKNDFGNVKGYYIFNDDNNLRISYTILNIFYVIPLFSTANIAYNFIENFKNDIMKYLVSNK